MIRTGKKGEDFSTEVEAVKRYATQYLGYRGGSVRTLKLPVPAAAPAVVAKKKRKLCSVYECANGVIKGGVCWRHGAKELSTKKKKKKCSETRVKKTVAASSESVCSGGASRSDNGFGFGSFAPSVSSHMHSPTGVKRKWTLEESE